MSTELRVIDSGIAPGREQIAFDQALVDLHKSGDVPDTLRFLQFRPTVLVGRHQALAREVHLAYCQENRIDLARRLSGGGAIYMDEGQLGWELVLHKSTLGGGTLPEVTRRLCEAAAAGISRLGVEASYRPFSDIEVDGRKISGTGGFFDGDTLIYQGTLLMTMDPSVMVQALNIPQADPGAAPKDQAEQRVVTLADLLPALPDVATIKQALVEGFSSHLNLASTEQDISAQENELACEYHHDEIGTDEFVYSIDDPTSDPSVLTASHGSGPGQVNAHVRLEGQGDGRIRQVLLTGDFFVAPSRTVMDLESALRGVPVQQVPDAVDQFFADQTPGIMTVQVDDIKSAIGSALAQAPSGHA